MEWAKRMDRMVWLERTGTERLVRLDWLVWLEWANINLRMVRMVGMEFDLRH